jgi:flagellar hook capping protein FlgD
VPRGGNELAAIAALEEGPVRFRHVLAASALALASSSCKLGDVTDAGTINIYLGVNDSQLTVGQESITITVTTRNVGYTPLTLTGPSDCLVFIEIRDHQGGLVFNSNVVCTGAQVTEEIAAGADKVQQFTWDGSNTAGAALPPGLYNIRAVARVTGGAYASPPITVALD